MKSIATSIVLSCLITLVGCTREATPITSSGTPLDLGLDAFLPSGAEDAADDNADLVDDLEDGDLEEPTLEEGAPCSILQNDCDPGLRCTIGQGGQGICALIGPWREGEPCGEFGDDCSEGLICLDPGDASTLSGFRCYRLCNSDAMTGCDPQQICRGPLEWVAEPVGICLE